MGQSESIPTPLMQPPRYTRRHNLERPGGFRLLFWRLAVATPITIALDVDVALCFGDVCRVLQLLAADDAELDDGAHPSARALLPVQHKRLAFVNGMLSTGDQDDDDDEEEDKKLRRRAVAIFAGAPMDSNRQICEHSGLQKYSTLHVVIPRQSIWLALPRPPGGITASGDDNASGWALPAGWDQGLQEVVANHNELKLAGRAAYIRRMLEEAPRSPSHTHSAKEDPGMRLIDRRDCTPAQDTDGGGGGLIDALMANVTDRIDDPPLDFYVGLCPPASVAPLYAGTTAAAIELVIHTQLPSTFPLSSERCRMLTPILHPLVVPLWDNDDDNEEESGVRARSDGGRMARPPTTTFGGTTRTAFVFAFREALIDPVSCAALIVSGSGLRADADARVRRWAANANGEMEAKARRLASESGRIQWRPELHGVCPRAFRDEARTLLLVLRRISSGGHPFQDEDQEEMPVLPREVVWLIIDALLDRHLSSGSLLFS